MKKIITTSILVLASFVFAAAQSINPLNYSGRMYVEAIEIIQTPRYVSYEDHAILSQQMRIPSVQITKCEMDFEKGTVTVDNKEMRIKVNATKKYDTNRGWVVVIYTDLVDEGDKAELVWPEFGNPYFQQITKADNGVNIARMVLTNKPYVADEGEALMNLLQGLGTI
ncbi:MAG: hypothetical protein IJU74_00045 [Bacteroidales bacterium]|nr:hypothetical protein [Bacteroidales bacterium]